MPREPRYTERRLLHLEPEMVREIETFRFDGRFKTEADAIRRLIELGLEASKVRQERPKEEAS